MRSARQAFAFVLLLVSLIALPGCDVSVSLDGDKADTQANGQASSPSPETGTYAGTTSQGLPIAFSVGGDGRVGVVQFAWRARCEDGRVYVNTIVLPGGRIKDGDFATGGTLETGGIGHVSGRFDGSRATGVLSRSRGTAFGVNCRLTGVEWSAEPGPLPAMPPPSVGGVPGQSL